MYNLASLLLRVRAEPFQCSCHLNNGHVKNNKYCENAMTLVKELFVRQQRNVVIINKLLFQEDIHMITEIERLQQAPRTAMNNDLLKAAKVLCKDEYERFYEIRKKAEQLSFVLNLPLRFSILFFVNTFGCGLSPLPALNCFLLSCIHPPKIWSTRRRLGAAVNMVSCVLLDRET